MATTQTSWRISAQIEVNNVKYGRPRYSNFFAFVTRGYVSCAIDIAQVNPGVMIHRVVQDEIWTQTLQDLYPSWVTNQTASDKLQYLQIAMVQCEYGRNVEEYWTRKQIEFPQLGHLRGVDAADLGAEYNAMAFNLGPDVNLSQLAAEAEGDSQDEHDEEEEDDDGDVEMSGL